jgi:hypothetical protein
LAENTNKMGKKGCRRENEEFAPRVVSGMNARAGDWFPYLIAGENLFGPQTHPSPGAFIFQRGFFTGRSVRGRPRHFVKGDTDALALEEDAVGAIDLDAGTVFGFSFGAGRLELDTDLLQAGLEIGE